MPLVENEIELETKPSFVQKYNISDAVISEMSKNYLPLKVSGLDDKEGYEKVREARIIVKQKRVEVEKKRVELKDESLRYGRAVDAEAKRITALLQPIEKHLTEQQDIIDKEKARQDAAKKEADDKRVQAMSDEMLALGVPMNLEFLREMTPEDYQVRLGKAQYDHAEKQTKILAEENARKEENDRLEKIRNEQAIEAKRIADAKAEQDKREAAIKAEQEKREAAMKAEQQKIENEKQAFENEKRKAVEAEQQRVAIEKAKKDAAERAVKEAEEKAKAEKEAAERAWREAEEQRLAEEALRPDKEKLLNYIHAIELVELPKITNKKADAALYGASQAIREVCSKLRRNIQFI